MKLLSQYKGLRPEIYILTVGRIVTSLGSMVWPMLTMILNQKLGFSASMVAILLVISTAVMMPVNMLGGYLADRLNKKRIIIICDSISVLFYILTAFTPLSVLSIIWITIAASCQSMEYPAYNALIADLSSLKDREKAYSLQYLGANLGLVLSPTIAGFLFQNYLWLAFLISGISIGCSTLLIGLFVRNITPVEDLGEESQYQKSEDGESIWNVMRKNGIVVLYIAAYTLYAAAYSQYGYLMPLDLAAQHGEQGAVIYGTVSSLNCLIVILTTPLITQLFAKMFCTRKTLVGEALLLAGYLVFLLFPGMIPVYYITIVLLTFGEVFSTIADGPYLSSRIPASHRGRFNSLTGVLSGVLQGISTLLVGLFYDHLGSPAAWLFVIATLCVAIAMTGVMSVLDRRRYPALYEEN